MGKLSTVDLLVQTNIDWLIVICNLLLTFFTKQASLIRRSTVTYPYPSGGIPRFPGYKITGNRYEKLRLIHWQN